MPRHEALYCRVHAPTSPMPVEGTTIMSTRDGARAKDDARERYERDAAASDRMADMAPSDSVASGLRRNSARKRKFVSTAKRLGY